MEQLARDYPWTKTPLVCCAPMRQIALAPLAMAVSDAGGLGFIGAGDDGAGLGRMLGEAQQLHAQTQQRSSDDGNDGRDVLPVGVGFLLWAGAQLLADAKLALATHVPAAVWLFAAREPAQLEEWVREVRRVTGGRTKVWVQVGTVGEAVAATVGCAPDVLVVQGTDAGGHGLQRGAGLVPLLPEVADAVSAACSERGVSPAPALVAAGGIVEGRGAAAAVALGAAGVVLGTRYLASREANITKGYQDAVLGASDGGVTTERGKLYDTLRGTKNWPLQYGGRGVLNESYFDAEKGMTIEENTRRYDEALKEGDKGWGTHGRLTTYAGTGVGLVKSVQTAAQITEEVRKDAKQVLQQASSKM